MKRAPFVVLAAIAALGIAALASAAGKPPTNPNNPVITFVAPSPAADAVLTDGDVTFAFTYNRTPKQTATVTCALSGQASVSGPCDTPVLFPSNSKTTSKSGESYTDLANGEYTFTVTLALTGGGVYTAARDFTVDVPPVCSVENTTTNATYLDVQSAVNAASTGEELEVTGTCTGSVLIRDKTVDLTGTTSAPQSTLVGQLRVGVNNGGNPGHSTVTNLTVTGSGSSGVFIDPDSSMVLKDSLVTGNESGAGGGGIFMSRSSLTLDNSDVTNNTARAFELPPGIPCLVYQVDPGQGGGIIALGTPFVGSHVTLVGDSDITGNTAEPGADCSGNPVPGTGGGIERTGVSTVTFQSWTGEISGNTPSADQCNPDLTLPDTSTCQ